MESNNNYFRPSGVYPAMLTPFDSDGNVNEKELRKYVSWLIKQGVHGLFPLGSAGEFIHMETSEKVKVMEIVVNEADGRVPVTPGTTETCSKKCINLTKIARDLGCKAAVISPPYYFPASQEIIEAHYEEVATALPDFSIILYNIPLFSTPICYDVVKRLSRIDNVVAMKDSSGSMVDLLHYMDKIKVAGEDLNILIGREEMLYSALNVGAKGTMTGSSGIIPEIMVEIYDSFMEGDFNRSLELQFSMLNLVRAMFACPFPLGFKAALECRGFEFGEPKQTLSDADQYNYFKIKSRIYKIMKQLLGDRLVARF